MLKTTSDHPTQVAVIAFDGISPFHLSVPNLVFGDVRSDVCNDVSSDVCNDARSEAHGKGISPYFKVKVVALEAGRGPHTVQTSAGFSINTAHGLAQLARADIIVLPSWRDDLAAPPARLLAEIRKAHKRGARIIGLCLGAFVLAEAGLLDGRSATTHWALAGEFARRYPHITLDPNVLYVDHGDVITSAGTAAGIDCCLHVLRSQFGSEVASQVARRLVVAPHRQGGQAQYIAQPVPTLASDARLSRVLEWMLQHLGQTQTLDQLAQQALMSRRSFTRHFQQLTGSTVGNWLVNQRLVQAQRQLEMSRLSIDDIAHATGFGSAMVLRRQFARHFKTSPSAYRREFQGG